LLAAFVLLLLAAAIYVPPALYVFRTMRVARNTPELWIVPKPLSISSMVPSNGPKYAYFGFEFESPWAELKAKSETQGVAYLIFVGGYGLIVSDPWKSGEQTQVWNNIASKFGERSRYALLSRVLNETPDDLHLTISPRKMAKTVTLLNLKKIESPRIKTGLLSFHTDWMHGFQKGNPKDAETVYVAFDDREREVQLEIKGPEKLSQEQINRLLSTLRSEMFAKPFVSEVAPLQPRRSKRVESRRISGVTRCEC
jgi:hypothetical protein